jgi:sec-independent protein translocase protein TatC
MKKYIILGILVLSAIITPTGDIITMMIMAIPTYSTFEIGMLISKINKHKEEKC